MIKFSFKYSFLDENNDIIDCDEEDEFHASDIMDGNNSIFLSINPYEIQTRFSSRNEYADFFRNLSKAECDLEKLVDQNMFPARFEFVNHEQSQICTKIIIRMKRETTIKTNDLIHIKIPFKD
jgi:hypothetical protein